MSASRLLTLTGPGGIGKTRLALRVAAAVRRSFPDGIWVVELAGLPDEQLVPRTVTATLGLGDHSGEAPADVLLEYLTDRRVLLVLDCCEHLLATVAALATKLLSMAPRLRIVATSRRPLGAEGEQVLTVPPMTTPAPGEATSPASLARYEAVTLFTDRARAARPGFTITPENAGKVALLCHRLDGMPLAIELAAAQIRTLPIDELVGRVSALLTPVNGGDVPMPSRHRTLRAVMDSSYGLCSPAEQMMWSRASVFPGEFDLQDAEHVCSGQGVAERDVFHHVAGLVEESILSRDGEYFRQLGPVRWYGAELLARSGDETRTRERHCDWYQRVADRADAGWLGPDQLRWLAHLRHEADNLRAALAFCLSEPGQARGALRLASSLWNYWVFVFGSLAEGRRYLDQALALDAEPSAERAKALWVDAWFALRQGDVGAAERLVAECDRMARVMDDTSALARATHFRALITYFRGDADGAGTLLDQANALYRVTDDLAGSWMALFHLTVATSTTGDHERADAYGARCLAMCETRSAYLSRSKALWAVGYGRWLRGDQRRAADLITEGLRVMRETGDLWGAAGCLEVLAWIAAADGEHHRAARLLGAAQSAWRSMGTRGPLVLAASHDQCEKLLRDQLGADELAGTIRSGAQTGLDAATNDALSDTARAERMRSAHPTDHPLTPREREIAGLVARGMRNKEIADTLVIAQRTAEGHVEHIMQKLGFSSRVQIARWVVEQQR